MVTFENGENYFIRCKILNNGAIFNYKLQLQQELL